MGLLKCMLDEVFGDHAQSLQLKTIAQKLVENNETAKKVTAELDHNLIMSMVSADTTLGAKVANKALTYTGYESALLELNSIVQTIMIHVMSCTYGLFSSPKSPKVSNEAVVGLVDR